MKYKWLSLILAFFCLSGCGVPQPVPTQPVTEPVLSQTEPAGLYQPGSHLEEATGGALTVYPLGMTDATAFAFLGEDLALFHGSNPTTLTLLTGAQRYISASRTLSPMDPEVQLWDAGMAYYDQISREAVFLDAALEESHRIKLPETLAGSPVLSKDQKFLFYCTADGLRELELSTGLDRLLREMSFPEQILTGMHRDGKILECSVTDRNGIRQKLYLSAYDGRLLGTLPTDATLWTAGDFYCCVRPDGDYQEILCGTAEPRVLDTGLLNPTFFSITRLHGGVIAGYIQEKDTTVLDYYDLESGSRSAALTLPGKLFPIHAEADPHENAVWFLISGDESDLLCRWELKKSKSDDPQNYLRPLFTPENPDFVGLEACRAQAAQISEKHGIRILLWTEATASSPWDYDLTVEHRVSVISQCLEWMDAAFSAYPPGFLREAAAETPDGVITVCLVRDLLGKSDTGAPGQAAGVQCWDEKGNALLFLSSREDLIQTVHHELFHIFESRVFSRCDAFDSWQTLNPSGFSYDFNYTDHLSRMDSPYLSGEQQAFTDSYAMSYPREDRARIMEYAMMSDREACFQSETMQLKLRTLCLGLRKAFRLTDYALPLLWEQHLRDPIR